MTKSIQSHAHVEWFVSFSERTTGRPLRQEAVVSDSISGLPMSLPREASWEGLWEGSSQSRGVGATGRRTNCCGGLLGKKLIGRPSSQSAFSPVESLVVEEYEPSTPEAETHLYLSEAWEEQEKNVTESRQHLMKNIVHSGVVLVFQAWHESWQK